MVSSRLPGTLFPNVWIHATQLQFITFFEKYGIIWTLMSMFPLSYLIITDVFLTLINRKGLTGVKAEYAVRKYKSHRRIKRVFMTRNHSELWTKQESNGMWDALSSAILSLST